MCAAHVPVALGPPPLWLLTPLLLCLLPNMLQYDSTFSIIQSFAHKMADTAPAAVPSCTPRGAPSNSSGGATNDVPLLPADGTSQPAGRKLQVGARRG